MTAIVTEAEAREPFLTIHLRPAVDLTDDQFFELCQISSDLHLERNAKETSSSQLPVEKQAIQHQHLRTTLFLDKTERLGARLILQPDSSYRAEPTGRRAAWVSHERLATDGRAEEKVYPTVS
jgi:hypothetical protein